MYELTSHGVRVALFTQPHRAYWYAHRRGVPRPRVHPTTDTSSVVPW